MADDFGKLFGNHVWVIIPATVMTIAFTLEIVEWFRARLSASTVASKEMVQAESAVLKAEIAAVKAQSESATAHTNTILHGALARIEANQRETVREMKDLISAVSRLEGAREEEAKHHQPKK